MLAVCAVFVAPAKSAYAVTSAELQAELEAAQAHLSELANEVAAAGELLQDTQYELEQTEAQIADTEAKISSKQDEIAQTEAEIEETRAQIAEAQEILGNRISSSYKAGPVNFLSIVLSATSFDDFVSRVYYADAINQSDAETIAQIKDLKAQLEAKEAELEQQKAELEQQKAELDAQKAEQERLVAEAQARYEEYNARAADQAAYVNSLSYELQAKIEEERQAAIAAQQAAAPDEDAIIQAALEASGEDYESFAASAGVSTSSSGGGGLTAEQRAAILAAAYSQLGVSYVWGTNNPGVSFDCSGFTQYCYSAAGVDIPHSSAAQASISSSTSRDDWQAGDLVFWNGHVAVYAGDGQIIHANGREISTTSLDGYSNYTGGGTPYA